VFFLELDTYLQSTQAQLIVFLKYFYVLNGELHTIVFGEIFKDSSSLGTEFWAFHSFFFVKVALFLLVAFLWEFSFGCSSYIFCLLMRERTNFVRSIFNYGRFCLFSVFYVWMLFPLCSVIVRPLFFPDAFPIEYWNTIFICMASVAMAYLLLKLMVFWMDIFVHWIHVGKYQQYAKETRKLKQLHYLTLTREYYQVKKTKTKKSGNKKKSNKKNSGKPRESHRNLDTDDQMVDEQTTGIPDTKQSSGDRAPSVATEGAPPARAKKPRTSRSKKTKKSSSSRFSPLSIIVEPICAVTIALRSVFFRPSIVLKLFMERYENLRNFSLPKLPKQNLNSAFGAAIRNYREGDDALFEVDYVFFRVILWTVANAATTLFTTKLTSDGQKYRIIAMTSFQGLFLLYYMIHMPHKHLYQRGSVIFFNFLTLGVLVCFLLLIIEPNIANQDVIHWVIYGSFVLALLVLMVIWVCSTFWRCVRCFIKARHRMRGDSENFELTDQIGGSAYLRNGDNSEEELQSQNYSVEGDVSHHDMVEVLAEDEQELMRLEKSMSKTAASRFGSDQKASAGLAQANTAAVGAGGTHTQSQQEQDKRTVDLSKINTTTALPSALSSPQDNNYMMHEQGDSEESDVSEELESIATDDSIVLDFEKFTNTRRRSTNVNILMTPQDEDLVPATDFHVSTHDEDARLIDDGSDSDYTT